jgi:hypothetical protein
LESRSIDSQSQKSIWFVFGRRPWVYHSWSFAPSRLGVTLELANSCGSLERFVTILCS